MEKEIEKLLEVSVTAKRLKVSDRTVLRMIADPENPLKGIRVNKKCIRIFESSLAVVMSQRAM